MADNVYNLKFTLSNGDVIDAGQITAPQGPKGDKGDSADIPFYSSTPVMDGTPTPGSAITVARGDHRHPSDTSRQEKLVSGTNIKTINGQSVLGSGDISISGGGTIDADTLNGLLSGSNGIAIAKNSTGDKVQVALDLSKIEVTAATGIMTLTADASYTASSPIIKVVLKNNSASYTTIGSGHVSVHDSGYGSHVDISGIDISVYDGDMDTTYYFLHSGNTKKIFGKSIYGYGNIDLYKHSLVITATATNVSEIKALITFPSSSNTKIDSLTDLYTACSKFGEISASGYVKKAGKVCPIYSALCNSGDGIHFIEATLDDTTGLAWTAMTGITISDEVTTV